MWDWLKGLLSSPDFADAEKNRTAHLFNIIVWINIAVSLLRLVISFYTGADIALSLIIIGAVIVILLGLLIYVRTGHVKAASFILISVVWLLITLAVPSGGGVRGGGFLAYPLIILMAGMLLGGWTAIGFGMLSLIAGIAFFTLEMNGLLDVNLNALSLSVMFGSVMPNIIAVALLVFLYDSGFRKALVQAQRSAQETTIFRALAENAVDGVFMATSNGKITYANRAGYELLGRDYEQKEIDDLDFVTLIPAAEKVEDVNHETLLSTLQAGSWQGELQKQRQDGTLVDVHSTAFAIEDEQTEEAVALAAVIRDITQQKQAEVERQRLQQEVIEAQQQAIKELSTPVIPLMEGVIVMPLVGSIDTLRAKDVTRTLLAGISQHQAKVVILDITGVSVVDTGVANYLNKTIQAARLKGARTIVTGISDAVAETIVELGIDWSNIETLRDLQTGLVVALRSINIQLGKVQ
jgi:PAS domain S-box-containing protein